MDSHLLLLREKLWDNFRIRWDGSLATVIDSLEEQLGYKVFKTEPSPQQLAYMEQEIKEHERFYLTLRKWRKSNDVPFDIRIPSIRHLPEEHFWMYAQEMINWLTLKSIEIIRNDRLLDWYDRFKMLREFTDYDLKMFYKNEFGMDEDDYDFTYNCKAIDVLEEIVWSEKFQWFMQAIKYLEDHWCTHMDLHNSNVMLDNMENIYIIDFWPTETEAEY